MLIGLLSEGGERAVDRGAVTPVGEHGGRLAARASSSNGMRPVAISTAGMPLAAAAAWSSGVSPMMTQSRARDVVAGVRPEALARDVGERRAQARDRCRTRRPRRTRRDPAARSFKLGGADEVAGQDRAREARDRPPALRARRARPAPASTRVAPAVDRLAETRRKAALEALDASRRRARRRAPASASSSAAIAGSVLPSGRMRASSTVTSKVSRIARSNGTRPGVWRRVQDRSVEIEEEELHGAALRSCTAKG